MRSVRVITRMPDIGGNRHAGTPLGGCAFRGRCSLRVRDLKRNPRAVELCRFYGKRGNSHISHQLMNQIGRV
jgi:hypothetical protein